MPITVETGLQRQRCSMSAAEQELERALVLHHENEMRRIQERRQAELESVEYIMKARRALNDELERSIRQGLRAERRRLDRHLVPVLIVVGVLVLLALAYVVGR